MFPQLFELKFSGYGEEIYNGLKRTRSHDIAIAGFLCFEMGEGSHIFVKHPWSSYKVKLFIWKTRAHIPREDTPLHTPFEMKSHYIAKAGLGASDPPASAS